MKRGLLVLLLLAMSVSAGPALEKWSFFNKESYFTPTIKRYNDTIETLKEAIEELKTERNALIKKNEAETFVSVAALRAAGYKLELLEKPQDNPSILFYIQATICDETFTDWVITAQEWDSKRKEAQ
jgi:hypothetical protein